MHKILIIDDDPDVVALIRDACDMELPSEIEFSHTATEGIQKAKRGDFDLLILDLTLPDRSGLDVCKTLRSEGISFPILCLTSRSDTLDKVIGLEMGADDYVTKPFSPRELIARIKAIWRRSERRSGESDTQSSATSLILHKLRLELDSRQLFLSDAPVDLSRTEFDLFALFALHPGKVFRREELIEMVLGYTSDSYEPTITAHISRLRAKIESDPESPSYILTVRGVGYRFATQDELDILT